MLEQGLISSEISRLRLMPLPINLTQQRGLSNMPRCEIIYYKFNALRDKSIVNVVILILIFLFTEL